ESWKLTDSQVVHSALPDLTAKGVNGEPARAVAGASGIERLECVDNLRVQGASALLQQSAVRHFLGQRVLEGVLQLWEEGGLVQELRRQQPSQTIAHRLLRHVADDLQQGKRHVLTYDRGRLQQDFVFRRQAVDPGGEDRLHCRRHLDGVERSRHAVCTSFTSQ